jgi:hypothetical protein
MAGPSASLLSLGFSCCTKTVSEPIISVGKLQKIVSKPADLFSCRHLPKPCGPLPVMRCLGCIVTRMRRKIIHCCKARGGLCSLEY